MTFKGKNILITGGLGFIGSNLSRRLEELGAQISIFDIAKGDDICDIDKVKKVIKEKPDVIYHLAGFSGSKESNENVEKSFKINAFATVNLFELVLKYSPKTKIILSNSRLEYGKLQYLPVDEKHPTLPTSAYGLSKLIATQIALVFHKLKGLNVTIFRTSNVYGPHPTSKFSGYNIINHFIDTAQNNGILTVYGDGQQLRDYIFIDDLVEAFMLAADKHTAGEIYNLGFGEGIKLKDMAKKIIDKVGKGRLVFEKWPGDYRKVETGSYISEINKIKNDLGFLPKIGFDEGIEKTIQQS